MLVGFMLVLLGVGTYVWLQNWTFNADIAQLRERFPTDRDASVQPNLPAMVQDYAARAGGLPEGPATIHLRHRAELTLQQGKPPLHIDADQWLSSNRRRHWPP
mgnify:CR=1 FL=1